MSWRPTTQECGVDDANPPSAAASRESCERHVFQRLTEAHRFLPVIPAPLFLPSTDELTVLLEGWPLAVRLLFSGKPHIPRGMRAIEPAPKPPKSPEEKPPPKLPPLSISCSGGRNTRRVENREVKPDTFCVRYLQRAELLERVCVRGP